MKTVIAPNGHVHDVVTHELTDAEQATITAALAAQGIGVEPVIDVFHVLHLWAQAQLTTVQEVTALRAYAERTDARIAFHKAGVDTRA